MLVVEAGGTNGLVAKALRIFAPFPLCARMRSPGSKSVGREAASSVSKGFRSLICWADNKLPAAAARAGVSSPAPLRLRRAVKKAWLRWQHHVSVSLPQRWGVSVPQMQGLALGNGLQNCPFTLVSRPRLAEEGSKFNVCGIISPRQRRTVSDERFLWSNECATMDAKAECDKPPSGRASPNCKIQDLQYSAVAERSNGSSAFNLCFRLVFPALRQWKRASSVRSRTQR